jgi:hypothetical protein
LASSTGETSEPKPATPVTPAEAGLQPTAQPVHPGPESTRAREKRSAFALFPGIARMPTWLNFWVPLTASMLSLAVAIYSLIISTQDPELLLILPNQVYLSEIEAGGSEFHPSRVYLQPNFVSTGNNDRTELIRTLTLKVEPGPDGGPLTLDWREQGSWDFTEGLQVMIRSYTYSADAAPMLVNPNQAQQPVAVFDVPTDWTLQPDAPYRLTLTADRAVAARPLAGTAEMTVPAELIDAFKTQTQQTILTVPLMPIVRTLER